MCLIKSTLANRNWSGNGGGGHVVRMDPMHNQIQFHGFEASYIT